MKKYAPKFYCKKCDYKCSRKFLWKQHISTAKHKMITNDNKMITKNMLICACGKSYKFSSGLSRHKKKCPYTVEKSQKSTEAESSENHALLLELKEMKEIIKKHGLGTVNNNNQTYNNNQKININVFLNEHCKNAICWGDFIKNLQLTLQDVSKTSQLGFTEGVSNILLKNLNDLPVIQRPIHCSDVKRQKFYIKDKEDGWNIDASNQKVDKAIDEVKTKQFVKIKDWEEKNPDFLQNDKKMKEWQIMVRNLSGAGIVMEKETKIIKKKLGEEVNIKDAMSTIEIK